MGITGRKSGGEENGEGDSTYVQFSCVARRVALGKCNAAGGSCCLASGEIRTIEGKTPGGQLGGVGTCQSVRPSGTSMIWVCIAGACALQLLELLTRRCRTPTLELGVLLSVV